jgi:hypothetical protein
MQAIAVAEDSTAAVLVLPSAQRMRRIAAAAGHSDTLGVAHVGARRREQRGCAKACGHPAASTQHTPQSVGVPSLLQLTTQHAAAACAAVMLAMEALLLLICWPGLHVTAEHVALLPYNYSSNTAVKILGEWKQRC